jgi:type I restriction enzyme M protein
VRLYNPANRYDRAPTWSEGLDSGSSAEMTPEGGASESPEGRWRVYGYDELIACDKAGLDDFRLEDESLADSDNMPPPGVIAQQIVEDLEAARRTALPLKAWPVPAAR